MIREAALAELQAARGPVRGIAGAANGGDILFHEACDELGVPTEVHLAKSPAEYVEESVADGGPDWIARFAALTASRPVHVLEVRNGDSTITVWDRNNVEMLQAAKALAGREVTLIALWDGELGDGPGGTSDMVRRAREAGGRVILLDSGKLLGG
jgi:hypothetical protein